MIFGESLILVIIITIITNIIIIIIIINITIISTIIRSSKLELTECQGIFACPCSQLSFQPHPTFATLLLRVFGGDDDDNGVDHGDVGDSCGDDDVGDDDHDDQDARWLLELKVFQ